MLNITSREEFIDLRKQVIAKDFKRMNDRQREAVFTADGPVLILAGAGSGKTTVVVNRIANLIKYGKAWDSTFVPDEVTENDVLNMRAYLADEEKLSPETAKHISVSACLPWKIMAITFTNKAAGELKERLCNMLGEDDGNEIWASTFHSSCARILRRDADRLGYTSHFTIYDSDDCKRMMKACMKQLDISDKAFPVKSVINEISHAKDSLIDVDEFKSDAGDDYRLKKIGLCYELYQRKLREADAMDFDDLIVNTVKLFEENPDILEYYQNRFRYLMVDEYQDTNHAQYRFVKLLAEKSQNICVVGDDDQSIYKFRGATIENIMSFEKTFAGAKVIRLEQNYRSTQNILDAANAIIENNTERKGKNLWTQNGEGDKIVLITAKDEQDEADKVAEEILKGVAEGRKYSDYAILYRMNSQSLSFERMFAKQGIPHRILGGLRFYERAEIKDLLAYLSVINNHDDEIRLRRIINTPKRSIGNASVDNVEEISRQIGESMYEVMRHAEDFPKLSRAAKGLKAFTGMIDELSDMLESEEYKISDVYSAILEKTNYLSYLKTSDPERADDKAENVKELASNIARYEEDGGNLTDFLEEIALITDIDNYDNEADTVVLMTVHSAKGLEFPVVFLPGWEDGVFPGRNSIYNPEELEEERRLAYVAVTRAKQRLFILNAEQRMVFGQTNRNKLSCFAKEIPTELIERRTSREKMTFNNMFSNAAFSTPTEKTNTKAKPFGGGFSAPPKVKPTPAGTYNAGDTVMHKTFGKGLILSVNKMGNDFLLEISFEKVGTKKLMANFARLEKVNG